MPCWYCGIRLRRGGPAMVHIGGEIMWVNQAHMARCHGKIGYSNGNRAERRAKMASERSGEWIIAYECPDCGFWHIGHPDMCQYEAIAVVLCKGCREPIPIDREGKFCKDQCKLDYVARKANKAMLSGNVKTVSTALKSRPAPLLYPHTGNLVTPQLSPRPIYEPTIDLGKITTYTRGAKTKKEKRNEKWRHEGQENNHSTSHIPPDLVGVKFGGFTVLRRITGKWEVECICGAIDHRSSKAVVNPANTFDACVDCRRPVGKLRNDIWKEFGVDVSWEDCFQHIYEEKISTPNQ